MGYTIWPDGSVGEVLQAVYRERIRQEDLMESGKFSWTCASSRHPERAGGDLVSHSEKLAVLAEEFGEISREVVEDIIRKDKLGTQANSAEVEKKLKTELIQLAAVAVAWAEALSR